MVMCKPAGTTRALAFAHDLVHFVSSGADGGGTALPWHQDGGEHWALDRDPLLFVWIALTEVRSTVRDCAFQPVALPRFPAHVYSSDAGHKSQWRSSGALWIHVFHAGAMRHKHYS